MTTGVSTRLVDRRRSEMAARYRRRRTILLGVVAGAAVVAGTWWVATGPLMTVSHVSVTGYTKPDQSRVVHAIQVAARGGDAFNLPTAEIERALADSPWVASVDVSHDRPRGLRVAVTEAAPRAVAVAGDGSRYLVAADGRVLDGGASVTAQYVATLPQIQVTTATVGDFMPSGTDRAPLTVAVAISPDVSARVRDLRVANGVLTGRLLSGPEVRFGQPIDLQRKARALDALLADAKAADILMKADYVDLSSPDRPIADGGEGLASEASTEGQDSGSSSSEASSGG